MYICTYVVLVHNAFKYAYEYLVSACRLHFNHALTADNPKYIFSPQKVQHNKPTTNINTFFFPFFFFRKKRARRRAGLHAKRLLTRTLLAPSRDARAE